LRINVAPKLRSQYDDCLDGFAAAQILGADNTGLLDCRMLIQQGFHFGRPYLEARGVDHAFEAIEQKEVAVFVHLAQIAGAKKPLAVEFDKRSSSILRLLPVDQKHLRAVDD